MRRFGGQRPPECHISSMRTTFLDDRALDLCSFVGVLVGMGLLIPSFLFPNLGALTLPAFAILLPSLLFAAR